MILLIGLLGLEAPAAETIRGPRPPVLKDDDMASIPEPAKHHDALTFDFLHNTFGLAPQKFLSKLGDRQPAWNVNAWDEVPDSSWFTNRNHLRPLTLEEIRRGAGLGPAPDLSGPLTVLEGKTAGTSLGFGRTRDARGNIYFIKFDPGDYPEISTAAEVIGSRLFHAMGFNVPAEWIVCLRADQLRVDPQATIWGTDGRKRQMTQDDIEEVLSNAARLPDGRYRAVASLLLSGKNKGAFKFHGTRQDDANDLVPHENRRELRGLRLFSAWLNHYDIRAGNTLEMYVEEGGRKFLRHHLLDFGSTLGSASRFPKVPRMGSSYLFDAGQMAGPLLTLGLYQPAWREQPARIEHASIGPFETASFSPLGWKPVWPVVSFSYMDNTDAFWAAKIVMSFTEAQVRAAAQGGELSNSDAEDFLVRTLIERQRKIGRYGLSQVNPLDRFEISGRDQQLEFDDLAVRYGFANAAPTEYTYTLSRSDEERSLAPARTASQRRIPLGESLELLRNANNAGSLYVLTLRARRAEPGFTDKWVKVYLEFSGSQFQVKGWEREN